MFIKSRQTKRHIMKTKKILDIAISALENLKAENISVMSVEHLTDLMSYMIVCTANSGTHAKAIASHLQLTAKKNNLIILGVEGETNNDWILVDLAEVVIHIMKERTRNLYQLEKLWDIKPILD